MGGGGGGGERERDVYLHIGKSMQGGSLSLTRGVLGGEKIAFVLVVVVPVVVGSNEDDSQSSGVESLEPHPPKKHCSAKSKKISTQRKYNKKWEKDFLWLEYDHNYQEAFCKVCRKQEPQSLKKKLEVHGLPSRSRTGKRQWRK